MNKFTNFTPLITTVTKPTLILALPLASIIFSPLAFSQIANKTNKNSDLEEIVIKAHPLHENGLSQSVDVLYGDELSDALATNIGDTLAQQPGMRSASFGAAAGRPVIHGLGGTRVKTTEDGIDSLDLAVTSTDHPVTIDPFIAKQITVLKGPSTLLYGSGAIGGVVDVNTGRIPSALNEEPFSGKIELRVADNADAKAGTFSLDGNAGDQFAWHIDGFSKQGDDFDIPGFAESAALRAEEALEEDHDEHDDDHDEEHDEHHEEEGHDEEEQFGTLEGSNFDLTGGAAGFSWVGSEGHIGVALSSSKGVYGLIGHAEHGHEDEHDDEHEDEHHDEDEHEEEHHDEDEHGDEHGEEEGSGKIDFKQTRFDISAEKLNPLAGIEKLNFRFGINDYEHSEIEGSGEVGTRFTNEAWEAHINASHEAVAGFTGTFGLQLGDREFSAIGEEAFIPPSETDNIGAYWVGEREFEQFSLEVGARVENVENSQVASSSSFDFSTKSASAGVVIPASEQTSWHALIDYAERAPSIEELFSNGPHLATLTFELGDTNLDVEKAMQLSLSWGYETDRFDIHATLYHNDFNDFIYQANTGEIEDDLPVFLYQQDDASFTGLDLEFGLHLTEIASGDLDLVASFDTIDASFDDSNNGNLPRIPSSRWSTNLIWQNSNWRAKLSYTDTSAQNDVAILERATSGFSDISAKLEYTFETNGATVSTFIHGKNLGDEEQRAHTSFIKDLAPAAGRTIEAGVRVKF